jgi:predicted RNase H-like HicB family nuclease
MALVFYPAFLEPSPDGGYGIFFPDIEGCASGGDDQKSALANAVEGLQGHLDLLREYGQPIPPPSGVISWPRWAGPRTKGVISVLVPAEIPEAAVRLNITMDKGLLARIDRIAQAEGMTRSGFLAQAAREKLAREKHAAPGGRKPKKAA